LTRVSIFPAFPRDEDGSPGSRGLPRAYVMARKARGPDDDDLVLDFESLFEPTAWKHTCFKALLCRRPSLTGHQWDKPGMTMLFLEQK
jgi:hypothetical protein